MIGKQHYRANSTRQMQRRPYHPKEMEYDFIYENLHRLSHGYLYEVRTTNNYWHFCHQFITMSLRFNFMWPWYYGLILTATYRIDLYQRILHLLSWLPITLGQNLQDQKSWYLWDACRRHYWIHKYSMGLTRCLCIDKKQFFSGSVFVWKNKRNGTRKLYKTLHIDLCTDSPQEEENFFSRLLYM